MRYVNDGRRSEKTIGRAVHENGHNIHTLVTKDRSLTKPDISINAFYIYARAPPCPNRGVEID